MNTNHHEPRTASLKRVAHEAPMLDADTERELALQARAGDNKAMRSLVVSHLRLVISAAQPYSGGNLSLDDLVSEGCLGLMEAVRRFDPDRGNRFSTYAIWWVRAHLRRFALANRRIVSTPSTRNARRVLGSLSRARRDIAQREGRPPQRHEIASALGVNVDDVAMVESALAGRDVILGPDVDGTTRDLPAAAGSPEELAAGLEVERQNQKRVAFALSRLSAREREIVRRRLLDEDRTSLSALGEHFGVSRERVRQIQQRAQAKLRTALLEEVA